MSVVLSRRAFVSAAAVFAASANAARSDRKVNVSDYDALSNEQLGVSNHVVRIATQPTGEWYGMGIQSFQGGDEGYR